MTINFNPDCKATAIGSFPHKSTKEAYDLIFKYLPDIPVWPQLPQIDFKENMNIQYSEKLPGLKINEPDKKIFFDISGDYTQEITEIYENYIISNWEYFNLSDSYSKGFVEFYKLCLNGPKKEWVKGHITGPITFGLSITDQNLQSIIYNTSLFDCIIKTFTGKACWQVNKLKEITNNVIIFIDEPYLASFGSAYFSISKEQIITILNEMIDTIHTTNALVGIHCCGNTDWSVVMSTNIDIINFDAYEYAYSFLLYPEHIKSFLTKGGIIAYGMVPCSINAENETTENLILKLKAIWQKLTAYGIDIDTLHRKAIITPACGLGTLSRSLAEKILNLTYKVSLNLKGSPSRGR